MREFFNRKQETGNQGCSASKYFQRIIKYFLQVLTAFVFLFFISRILMGDYSSLKNYKELFFLVIGFVVTKEIVSDTKSFVKSFVLMFFIGSSIAILNMITKNSRDILLINRYVSLYCCISCIIIIITSCLKNKILNYILVCIYALPGILFTAYYFSEGIWFGSDAVIAIAQTNARESIEFVSDHFSWWGLIAIIIICFAIILVCKNLEKISLKENSNKFIAMALALCFGFGILCYRSRINIFTNVLVAAKKDMVRYNDFKKKKTERENHVKNLKPLNKVSDGVYFLVLGESQNKSHLSAYGYERKTTPWLDSMKTDKNFILFNNAYSCHTHTVPALTYALTAENQYNKISMAEAVSLLEAAESSGFETIWLSNQVKYSSWDTPITVIASEANQQKWINHNIGEKTITNFYDDKLIGLIDGIKLSKKTLVVIHLMGSHGSYYMRYPKEFTKFKDKKSVDYYDNSIAYTDNVLNLLFEKLKKIPNFKGMVYLSDHAEAVDENLSYNSGKFGWPIARIPMFMYFTDSYIEANKDKFKNLQESKEKIFTNDLLFDTMLGIMNINLEKVYVGSNDLSSKQYNADLKRFRTLHGKRKIEEDIKIKSAK